MSGGEQSHPGAPDTAVAIPIALLLPLVLAILGGIFVYSTEGGHLPFPTYYGLAAQIIPVLMIAFALENRAMDLLSGPQMRFYRVQLFLFLLGGEIFALIGASGVLRGATLQADWSRGMVGGSLEASNMIAAGTTAGLVGGFAMLAVLGLFWGPGWITFSFLKKADEQELDELRQKVRKLEDRLDSAP